MSTPPPPHVLPDYNSGPRNFLTSNEDHGGVALVLCTLMATWALLTYMVRLYMRFTVSGPFGADDYVCSVAMFFGLLQMGASCAAVSYGFGKFTDLLTPSQVDSASKALYTAQLLYIITNALTKCSVALLLARIVFIKNRVMACYGVLGLSAAWGLASFLTEAIRCTDSPPWKIVGSQCSNTLVEWKAITAFNVIIEVCLFALPTWLVWTLQTNNSRKFVVLSVFALRLPVIAAAIVRIHYLNNTIGYPQPLYSGVIPFICLNVEMHYGLMSATWPTLKPFVGAFNTGWGTYDTQGVSGYGGHSNGSYAMHSVERKNQQQGQQDAARSRSLGALSGLRSADRSRDDSASRHAYGKNVTHVRSMKGNTHNAKGDQVRSGSSSSDSTKQMIIRQTMTCEVHYEDQNERRTEQSSRGADSIDYATVPPPAAAQS